MKKFIKENWFKIIIILLLILCYASLLKIQKNTFYTADMVEESTRKIMYSLDDIYSRMEDVQSDVQSIYYEIQ